MNKIIAIGVSICLSMTTLTYTTQEVDNITTYKSEVTMEQVKEDLNNDIEIIAKSFEDMGNNIKTILVKLDSRKLVSKARMGCALRDEEVNLILTSLRSDIEKIDGKYNQALSMSSEAPNDEVLKDKVTQLYLYNEEAKKISDELNTLTSSEINESSEAIKEYLLALLPEYQTRLAPIFTYASLVDLDVNLYHGEAGVTEREKLIVETGMSLLGKIPYQWGGKASNGGWNKRWDKEGNGMDCSGFVEWVYWTITGHSNEGLRSTITIASRQKQISRDELRIGDLGMKYPTGTRYADYSGKIFYSEKSAKASNKAAGMPEEEIEYLYNHVGIYVGKDMNGNDLWVHCKGEPISTVTVGVYEDFTYYYAMPN